MSRSRIRDTLVPAALLTFVLVAAAKSLTSAPVAVDARVSGRWATTDELVRVRASESTDMSAVEAPDDATSAPLAVQIVNEPYRSEFTFVRIRFDVGLRGGFGRRGGGREPPWAHDYPRAERNFARLLDETTLLRPYLDGGNIITLDDPDLLDYPIAYISEPGYWTMTDQESEGLREYLLRGGFLIADDFRGGDWFTFEEQLRRALPELQLVPLSLDDRVFDSFFRIESLDFAAPTFDQFSPEYWGLFENNDRERGRLMVVANYNNDIGDYWEWSDAGFLPIPLSNEAYKLGINYVIYALTH